MISSFRRRAPVGVFVALGVSLILACSTDDTEDDTQFREDVIWCEESVAHLEECCGTTFDASQIECRHYYSKNTGCNQTTITRVDPAYTPTESRCIRDTACNAIRQNGICERALAAGKARRVMYQSQPPNDVTGTSSTTSTSSTSGSSAIAAVCP